MSVMQADIWMQSRASAAAFKCCTWGAAQSFQFPKHERNIRLHSANVFKYLSAERHLNAFLRISRLIL